jgi:hypothetical protein
MVQQRPLRNGFNRRIKFSLDSLAEPQLGKGALIDPSCELMKRFR